MNRGNKSDKKCLRRWLFWRLCRLVRGRKENKLLKSIKINNRDFFLSLTNENLWKMFPLNRWWKKAFIVIEKMTEMAMMITSLRLVEVIFDWMDEISTIQRLQTRIALAGISHFEKFAKNKTARTTPPTTVLAIRNNVKGIKTFDSSFLLPAVFVTRNNVKRS